VDASERGPGALLCGEALDALHKKNPLRQWLLIVLFAVEIDFPSQIPGEWENHPCVA